MEYTTYILYSLSLDTFYVGSTQNIDARIKRHNLGHNKYTKTGIPWELVYSEEYETRSVAMIREKEIKAKKSRKYIEWLISSVG